MDDRLHPTPDPSSWPSALTAGRPGCNHLLLAARATLTSTTGRDATSALMLFSHQTRRRIIAAHVVYWSPYTAKEAATRSGGLDVQVPIPGSLAPGRSSAPGPARRNGAAVGACRDRVPRTSAYADRERRPRAGRDANGEHAPGTVGVSNANSRQKTSETNDDGIIASRRRCAKT